MAEQPETIKAFVKLGEFLGDYCHFTKGNQNFEDDQMGWYGKLDQVVDRASSQNGWFTQENILLPLNNGRMR